MKQVLLPLLFTASAASCATDTQPPPVPTAAPPSVLLITLDTTRADALGAYGGRGRTPALDALAAEGARFDRAFTVAPLTIPAHASLLTGLYPGQHGIRDNGDRALAPGAVTLAERLSEAGYATAASVGAHVTSRAWGFDQGFDAFYDTTAAAAGRAAPAEGRAAPSGCE